MTSALHAPAATGPRPPAAIQPQRTAPASPRPYLTAVPDCEPPFDDQRSAVSRLQRLRAATQSRLAAAPAGGLGTASAGRAGTTAPARRGGTAAADPVVAGEPRSAESTVPDTVAETGVPGWSQEADMGVRRTATSQLPPAGRSGSMLARALVEVLCGQRAVPQLRVHCAPDVFAGLLARPATRGALGHLLTVRVAEPADGVAEVAAVYRRGERVRALAFRMQGVDGRWRVTALQTG